MKHKDYYAISGGVFSIIAIAHLVRIVYGWEAMIGGLAIPMWASWVVIALASFLAYSAFKLNK